MSANESKSWFVEHLKTGGVFLLRGVEHSIRDSGRDALGSGGGERFAEGAAEHAVLPAHARGPLRGDSGQAPVGGGPSTGRVHRPLFPGLLPGGAPGPMAGRLRGRVSPWSAVGQTAALSTPTFLFLGVLAALSPQRLEEGPAPLPSPGELKVWGGRTPFARTCTRKHSHPPAA